MAAPCGNKTSRGHACYPLTTYCPNRPATYKRDTTGRPAKSAIYKPDTQPKPRPHAYTGTPARPHPRKTHCTHPRTHTTARGPAKSQVMSKRGIKSVRNRLNNTPIRSQPMLQHDSGHMRTATTPPAQHQTCTRTQTQVHTLKRNTYHKHTNTTHHIPSTTRRTPRTPEKRCHRPAAALG